MRANSPKQRCPVLRSVNNGDYLQRRNDCSFIFAVKNEVSIQKIILHNNQESIMNLLPHMVTY